MTLVKADLGIKRVCPSCAAHFYDLQKRPIECPKCQFTFEPESLYKQRRPRQPEPVEPDAADEIEAIEDIEDEDEEEDSGLLEEVEDNEDNVAGIIDPDIAKDER